MHVCMNACKLKPRHAKEYRVWSLSLSFSISFSHRLLALCLSPLFLHPSPLSREIFVIYGSKGKNRHVCTNSQPNQPSATIGWDKTFPLAFTLSCRLSTHTGLFPREIPALLRAHAEQRDGQTARKTERYRETGDQRLTLRIDQMRITICFTTSSYLSHFLNEMNEKSQKKKKKIKN
ncbi:hypothetical protein BKA57DRAFT_118587 [Linnemannia elongata]|nr:hypothetical protein BKA57DRAFT_118587 [Linnemannia elongata]